MCNAKFCAGFSAVGAVFMLWVVLMLSLQPFFINGIDNKNLKIVRRSSRGALIMYIVSFSIALGYAIYSSVSKKSKPDESLTLQESKATTLQGVTDYTPTIPAGSFHPMGGPNDGVLM